ATLGGQKQQGPLRGLLTYAQGDVLREVHEILAWTALVVVGAHVLGVVVSSVVDRENLAWGMLHGSKRAPPGEAAVARTGAVATPVAWQLSSRLRNAEAPLRITETRYWKRRHAGIGDADWARVKKIQCEGCHLDGVLGTFEPGAVKIPATAPAARQAK